MRCRLSSAGALEGLEGGLEIGFQAQSFVELFDGFFGFAGGEEGVGEVDARFDVIGVKLDCFLEFGGGFGGFLLAGERGAEVVAEGRIVRSVFDRGLEERDGFVDFVLGHE